MTFEASLSAYLIADPGVSDLVDDRVYPTRRKEKSGIPALTFQRITTRRIYTYDAFEDSSAWQTARVQFDCWAYTAEEAFAVGDAVLAALSGYSGDMAGTLLGSSFGVNEIDTYEGPTKFHRRMMEFEISYQDEPALS